LTNKAHFNIVLPMVQSMTGFGLAKAVLDVVLYNNYSQGGVK